MSYNSNLPDDIDIKVSRADVRENLRALKEDKIVDAATAIVADTANKLTVARKISLEGDAVGSTTFDGSLDATIQVDVLSADTAKKLETPRKINGVDFDGTKDITIKADTIGGYYPNDLMPLGAIVMWAGSIATIPSKWALCNGENGTPDLSGKFILGAGNTYNVGAVGGETSHVLTINEMPSHNHKQYIESWAEKGVRYLNGTVSTGSDGFENSYYWSSEYTGGNQAHNNMPPYYALAYIMRIA